ncbi:alpha/beta hydrolase family protein [Salisaeta longa]|uniref:alpha/beta hydrolase family protein n=1 Tax=Salisaeta longa TaxID=503170 RepID=UPI0003B7006B|nr:alpha/beta hydrolase [Salisaeta longa]
MLRAFVLACCVLAGSVAPAGAQSAGPDSSLVGTWMGRLSLQGTSLRVVFHLRPAAGDSLTGTMDSPDQGATGIPLTDVARQSDTLRVAVGSIAGRFEGVIGDSLRVIRGRWAQGGLQLPLVLRRTDAPPTVRRPQTPKPPFPYTTRPVAFQNPQAGITLRGTLTLPTGPAPHPGVVLIAGSGPQDRDGTLFKHKPLAVLADYLTRRGIAVLRFDERGVGASGGQQRGATTADLATDVQAALAHLATVPAVDTSALGLIGHSEGGLIAPMVANASSRVDFVVLLAASAVSGDVILADQLAYRTKQQGFNRRNRAVQQGVQQRIFYVLKQTQWDSTRVATELKQIMRDVQGISGTQTMNREVRRLMSPWLRYFITYDPQAALRQLSVPTLALFPGNDRQVMPDTNQTAMRQALAARDNNTFTIERLSGLNHLFQPSATGDPSEYGAIAQTFSPAALRRIYRWIHEQTPQLLPKTPEAP